jgi:hypothetical protein
MSDTSTGLSGVAEPDSEELVEPTNGIGPDEDPIALDPFSPLNPPADPWFDRFNRFGGSSG